MINKKKVQRLWRKEGLRVKVRKIRKRASASTTPITEANAPKVAWGDRLPVRFDDGREEVQDRVDGRRTHPSVGAQHGREIYPSRGSRRSFGEGVRALEWPAAGVAVRQWTRVHLRGVAEVL
ncbi:hypothetical protein EEB16_21040 [Rhodococcus sp. WS7]|nr:hypothetical protein EEB16_21040 [Rhodococcus sp. WS7]